MANTSAPFGFQHVGYLEGHGPTGGQTVRKIASNYGTAINFGDPVVSVNTGYIQQAVAGTTQIAGIFVGCKYLSTSQARTVWSKYWPGSDATGDVEAYIINSPNAIFRVQAAGSSTAIGFLNVNENVNFALGTPANGISGAYADQTTLNPATTTLPFRVVGHVQDPPGANGTDITTGFNIILVAFNNVDTKALTGI